MAWPRPLPTTEMKIDEFGRLPVVYDGRVKPLDTLARGTLKNLSGRETFKDKNGKKQPAVKWLLDTIAKPADAHSHPVIQIYNLEVLDTLGLKRREGFRYSIDEFAPKIGELDRQVQEAAQLNPEQQTIYQRKMLELAKKLETIQRFQMSFELPRLRKETLKEDLTAASRQLQMLSRMQLPLVVPPKEAKDAEGHEQAWQSFAVAGFDGFKDQFLGKEPNQAMISLASLLIAYSKGDVAGFNSELAKYQAWLAENSPSDYREPRVNAEAFYNAFSPLFWACFLYLFAFVLVALSWLGFAKPLGRAAFWMIIVALGFHTFGLIDRIYISGRPPVTNLYSSAVFIAWGCVVLAIILECIFRIGVGNVIGAVGGFLGLSIAIFGLDDGSDTLGVLQAVLDTQFWLATHVVCITLGYATTFMAGLLGVKYILRGVLTPSLSADTAKEMSRMIYGIVCFAMFFSFVGTVLGGLWADDSWGRFWGWDPKENGALIIVLWNALVLHARWGGMVKDRGLAALAVAGNIVTAWSWFGVNELGVGLHSYGFTEGVLLALGLFIVSQLAIISLALLPKNRWWSNRAGHAV
jgi:ABC-type transport system involved in cytochrome c biogenesis permease subunit